MENASKALLIAGGVLITMIVASFGVYLYGVYHEHSENMLAAMSEKEISQFNAKFLVYEDRELTANDVVSIMNLVRDNNKTKTGSEYQININVTGWHFEFQDGSTKVVSVVIKSNDEDYERFCNEILKNYSTDDTKIFKMEVKGYNETTGLINTILIEYKKI